MSAMALESHEVTDTISKGEGDHPEIILISPGQIAKIQSILITPSEKYKDGKELLINFITRKGNEEWKTFPNVDFYGFNKPTTIDQFDDKNILMVEGESLSIICGSKEDSFDVEIQYVAMYEDQPSDQPDESPVMITTAITIDENTEYPKKLLDAKNGILTVYSFIITNTASTSTRYPSYNDAPQEVDADPIYVSLYEETDQGNSSLVRDMEIKRGSIIDITKELRNPLIISNSILYLRCRGDTVYDTPKADIKFQSFFKSGLLQ